MGLGPTGRRWDGQRHNLGGRGRTQLGVWPRQGPLALGLGGTGSGGGLGAGGRGGGGVVVQTALPGLSPPRSQPREPSYAFIYVRRTQKEKPHQRSL